MMIKPELNPLFNFPICYHPTTVIFIDDEPAFLEILSAQLADRLAVQCFDKPAIALDYTKMKYHFSPFRERCWHKDGENKFIFDFDAIRKEMHNKDRFNETLINVTDYDMPEINGIEVTKTMEFNATIPRYAHIFLTGKASNDFKQMVKNKDYIGKDDPHFIDHLLHLIEEKATLLFSNYAYEVALKLARDPEEKAVVLLDGNFASVFNSCLSEYNACEYYLFDKQGSYVMLDADANTNWLFVRNETGMENSLRLAKARHAPKEMIDALESRQCLLSLYDKSDVDNARDINWHDYLLPATRFESNGKYFQTYADLSKTDPMVYYYATSPRFGNKKIERPSLLSYREFLNQRD